MLYRKNIYSWEQWLRIIGGVALAAWGGMFAGGGLVSAGWMIAAIVVAAGLATAVTGVFGWCPACAMVGRRIKDKA